MISSGVLNLRGLRAMKQRGERIAALTAYDASFAGLLDECGVELILVGDSLGMVVQGHASTVPVRLEQVVYHTQCVTRARRRAVVLADLPFMTYATPDSAARNAARLLQEGGCEMVKLEGGGERAAIVEFLVRRDIPVCGHLGLLPQNILQLGQYRVQAREPEAAEQLLQDARRLESAGAELLVLECIPAALGQRVTASLKIPTIGIGAGPHCDGQVLVLHDVLGLRGSQRPRFVKDFVAEHGSLAGAIRGFVDAVKNGAYPGPEHVY